MFHGNPSILITLEDYIGIGTSVMNKRNESSNFIYKFKFKKYIYNKKHLQETGKVELENSDRLVSNCRNV